MTDIRIPDYREWGHEEGSGGQRPGRTVTPGVPRRRTLGARWRALAALAAVAGFSGLAVPAASPAISSPAQPAPATSLSGVAGAGGVNLSFVVPQFLPVGDRLVDLGLPTAQALLDTGGGAANAYASLPNPGELLITLPGLAAGLAGGLGGIPAPSYPLYVASDSGNPERRFSDPAGVIVLEARSARDAVTASASITNPGAQPSVGKVLASAKVLEEPNGTVRSIGESRVEGFVLDLNGVVVRLGTVTSRSETVRARGDSPPDTTTTFDIAGATVNGVGITVGPDGVGLGPQPIPLPLGPLLDTVTEALAGAGVGMRVVATDPGDTGAASQYLEVTTTQVLPIPGNPNGTVIYRVGRVETSVVSGVGRSPVGVPIGSSPAVASGGPAAASSTAGPGAPTTSTGAVLPGQVAAAPAPAPVATVEPALLARNLRNTVRFIYSMLIVGGLAGLAWSLLWRAKGVRARWMP